MVALFQNNICTQLWYYLTQPTLGIAALEYLRTDALATFKKFVNASNKLMKQRENSRITHSTVDRYS